MGQIKVKKKSEIKSGKRKFQTITDQGDLYAGDRDSADLDSSMAGILETQTKKKPIEGDLAIA